MTGPVTAILARGDPAFPPGLATISDAPSQIWVRGRLDPAGVAVGIVGSRTATPQAREMAFTLAAGLARAGVTVISGMARGVDGEAHKGALHAGGRTIAVLGCGIDVVYPAEHAQLARQIAESGALVSELPPGTAPEPWHFPRRNRIISGLSLGVVVVEAAADSGSLITARCALEQGRPVMAVPGTALSGRNRGAHSLLRDGARLVEGVSDILEELKLEILLASVPADYLSHPSNDPFLREMAPGEPYLVEQLCELTGMGVAPALGRLAELELAGWIIRIEGARFVKPASNVLR